MNKEEAVKEIEKEEKWLLIAGYSAKNVDIVFDKIKSLISQLFQESCEDAISRSDMLDAIGHGTTYTSEGLQIIIKGLPSVNPQPCEDAISRQAAIDAVIDLCKYYTPTKSVSHPHMDFVIEALQDLPPVNPQPKTGHWIEHPEIETSTPEYLMFYECSECGDKHCFCKSDIQKKHFCNNCGAKMESQERNDEE